MTDFVFLGPSLPVDQAREILPAATYLPPVEHGDLLRIQAQPGDRVLIIDGLFMLKAPVRHREILSLLAAGVTVAGSSSMGALRAAELWRYGMRGFGDVFEAFRSGEVTGDDEVAVVHAMAEDEHRPLSEPLVNLRLSLGAAVRNAVVSAAESRQLLDACRDMPFRARSVRALVRAAARAEADQPGIADAADRYAAWAHDHSGDAKADDARYLLRLAAADSPELRPAGLGDLPIENLGNYLLEAWSTRHRGADPGHHWISDARVVGALMALHPRFPALHRAHVLAKLVGAGPDAPADDVRAMALRHAAAKGVVDAESIAASGWLTAVEQLAPIEDQTLTMMVRVFGTALCRPMALTALPPELCGPALLADVRQFVDGALGMSDRLPHPDPYRPHLRLHFRDHVVDRMLCAVWGCEPDVYASAAADRGFDDLDILRSTVEPFMAWMKMCGPPSFDRVIADQAAAELTTVG